MLNKKYLKILKSFLLSTLLVESALYSHAFAAPEWTAKIAATYGLDSNQIILGTAIDATDGFENGYESRAIMAGSLITFFYQPDWAASTPDAAEYFWTDIRATDLPKEWTFYISSSYTNKTINLNWEITAPDTLLLTLYDDDSTYGTGTSIDMKGQTSYSYTNTSAAGRAFRVIASGSTPNSGSAGGDTGGSGGSTPPVDITPPDTSISGITNDQTFAISAVNATLSGIDEISALSALQYSYKKDSDSWSAWSTNSIVSLTGLTDGTHILYAKAKDEAGNEDASPAQVNFKVDTAGPELYMISYENTVTTRTRYTVKFNYFTSDTSGTQVLNYTVKDEYNLLSLNGSVTPPTSGYTDFTVNLNRLVRPMDRNGRVYTIMVTSVDKVGNSTSTSVTYTVMPPPRQPRKPLF